MWPRTARFKPHSRWSIPSSASAIECSASGTARTCAKRRAELRGSKVTELAHPGVDNSALRGLKFSAALPEAMARGTVAGRLGDKAGSAAVLREDRVLTSET